MDEQIRRVRTGENPDGTVSIDKETGAPEGPTKATRFDSHAKEVEAVERAKAKIAPNEPKFYSNGKPRFIKKVIDDGPEGYGEGVKVKGGPDGEPLAGRPVEPTGHLPHATVIFRYNQTTDSWEPHTQFPSEDPVAP
jgi:hypothetical protein